MPVSSRSAAPWCPARPGPRRPRPASVRGVRGPWCQAPARPGLTVAMRRCDGPDRRVATTRRFPPATSV